MKPLHRNAILLCLLLAVFAPITAHAATYSRAKTRRIVRQAAKFYHVSPKWIVPAAIDIIYGPGAHESNGATNAGSGCVGILQFDGGWHLGKKLTKRAKAKHHRHAMKNWRRCGTCSLYRLVKVYHDGGKPKVREHWEATLGR